MKIRALEIVWCIGVHIYGEMKLSMRERESERERVFWRVRVKVKMGEDGDERTTDRERERESGWRLRSERAYAEMKLSMRKGERKRGCAGGGENEREGVWEEIV